MLLVIQAKLWSLKVVPPLCNLVSFLPHRFLLIQTEKLSKSTKLPVGKDQDEINKFGL
jgi:hypothetical protein